MDLLRERFANHGSVGCIDELGRNLHYLLDDRLGKIAD